MTIHDLNAPFGTTDKFIAPSEQSALDSSQLLDRNSLASKDSMRISSHDTRSTSFKLPDFEFENPEQIQDTYPRMKLLEQELSDIPLTVKGREAAEALLGAIADSPDSDISNDLRDVVKVWRNDPKAFREGAEAVNKIFRFHNIVGQIYINDDGSLFLNSLIIHRDGTIERIPTYKDGPFQEFVPDHRPEVMNKSL